MLNIVIGGLQLPNKKLNGAILLAGTCSPPKYVYLGKEFSKLLLQNLQMDFSLEFIKEKEVCFMF